MTDIDTAALRGLLAKATPGPWRASYEETTRVRDSQDGGIVICTNLRANLIGRRDANEVEANAALIAAAVNALPGLLDEVERLRADAARYQRLALLVEVGVWGVMSDAAGQCDDQDRMNYLLDHPDTIREADEWAAAIAARVAMQEQPCKS